MNKMIWLYFLRVASSISLLGNRFTQEDRARTCATHSREWVFQARCLIGIHFAVPRFVSTARYIIRASSLKTPYGYEWPKVTSDSSRAVGHGMMISRRYVFRVSSTYGGGTRRCVAKKIRSSPFFSLSLRSVAPRGPPRRLLLRPCLSTYVRRYARFKLLDLELRHFPNAIPFHPWHVAEVFIYKYRRRRVRDERERARTRRRSESEERG